MQVVKKEGATVIASGENAGPRQSPGMPSVGKDGYADLMDIVCPSSMSHGACACT